MTTPAPNITTPLVRDGGGENVAKVQAGLGPLFDLIGTWNNSASPPQAGYNVMPLPQATARNKYILKNFNYFEEMTFSAIAGSVPNRGGNYQQDGYVLFYEQRVFFGEGAAPDAVNTLVHAENGSWLHLKTLQQKQGPYGMDGFIPAPPAPASIPAQDPTRNIVKQVSVPHGNSILAVGTFQKLDGPPTIPNVSTLPTGNGVTAGFNDPFGPDDPGNIMVNPNKTLQDALAGQTSRRTPGGLSVTNTVKFNVSTRNPGGGVTNIVFEQKRANVTAFSTTFWLETLSDGSLQLQYSQTIEMTLMQDDVVFLHIDANTLRKVSS